MNHRPLFPIPQLEHRHLSWCEMYNAFDEERCQQLRDMGDLLMFSAGTIGNGVVAEETRDSSVAWIDDNPNGPAHEERVRFLHDMGHVIARGNRDKFQMHLDYFLPIQYTKYALNQHYDWHVDIHENMESDAYRKLSAILMLSKPEEYEGGELELNVGGNPDKPLVLKPKQGTMVFFYSTIPHRVRPVTSGDRVSAVVWAMGPRVR